MIRLDFTAAAGLLMFWVSVLITPFGYESPCKTVCSPERKEYWLFFVTIFTWFLAVQISFRWVEYFSLFHHYLEVLWVVTLLLLINGAVQRSENVRCFIFRVIHFHLGCLCASTSRKCHGKDDDDDDGRRRPQWLFVISCPCFQYINPLKKKVDGSM